MGKPGNTTNAMGNVSLEVFRTMVVPAALVESAREIAAGLSPRGAGMFTTPASPSGAEPATHYISSGYIDGDFAILLESPEQLLAFAQQGAEAQGLPMTRTLDDAVALVVQSDVSEEPPFDVLARLELTLLNDEDPA